MHTMSEPRKAKKKYPSREKVKYIPIPVELWDELDALGKADERSVSYMARKLIRAALDAQKPADSE